MLFRSACCWCIGSAFGPAISRGASMSALSPGRSPTNNRDLVGRIVGSDTRLAERYAQVTAARYPTMNWHSQPTVLIAPICNGVATDTACRKEFKKFHVSDAIRFSKIPSGPRMFRVDAFQASTLTKKVLDT
jgi:hypothetical protein